MNLLKESFQRKTRICDKLLIVIYLYLQLNLSSFWFIIKQQWTIEEIFIFSNRSHLDWRQGRQTEFWKGTIPAKFGLIWVSVVSEEMISMWKFTKYDWWTTTKAKWWQKLTWPFARLLKRKQNICDYCSVHVYQQFFIHLSYNLTVFILDTCTCICIQLNPPCDFLWITWIAVHN